MSKKILLINPLGVDIFDQITVDIVAPHLADDTEVDCVSLGSDAPPTPFLAPLDQILEPLTRKVVGAKAQGYDAVAISCSGDPGLQQVRAASELPVTGALEAACLAAGDRKTVFLQRRLPDPYPSIMPTQRGSEWLYEKIAGYGLGEETVKVRPVPIAGHPDPETVARMAVSDPDGLRELILGAMESAALGPGIAQSLAAQTEDGAAALYFNCTFWGGLLDPVADKVSVPVLDPLIVVARHAEALAAS
jgi:Asp/Glu/hydantoin racemase